MVRAAALVAGDGSMLQGILDSIYFNEFKNFELVAVICPHKEDYVMSRAVRAGFPAFVVDPDLFPTSMSHSMAVANKMTDLDIDLVILAGYDVPLGVIPYRFKNCIIGTVPCLLPAFEDCDPGTDVIVAALERGLKLTGATSYFVNDDGQMGAIILQKAIEIHPDDTPDSLRTRVMEDCEWKLLSRSVALFCENRISLHGNRAILEDGDL